MKKDRFKLVSAVHLLLVKDRKILLSRRFNTGYEDGKYSVPAGHLDGNEKATDAMIREGIEELGITLKSESLKLAHLMHRKAEEERIDFFFEAKDWQGEIKNTEPHKCDDLRWFSLDELPDNMVTYVKKGIENYSRGISFSEFGWIPSEN